MSQGPRARRGRQIALDVVRGLHHMHSRKVMHLDLKSANILLARDGTAKIADVGLAKILTRDNTCVSTEGTFDWAAPEVRAALPTASPNTGRGRESCVGRGRRAAAESAVDGGPERGEGACSGSRGVASGRLRDTASLRQPSVGG